MTWPGMCQFHGAMLGRVAEGGAGGNGAQRPVCLWHSLSSLFWSFCSNLARQAANNLGFNTSGGGKLHQLFKLLSTHQTSILHCFCLSDSVNLLPGQQPIRLPQAFSHHYQGRIELECKYRDKIHKYIKYAQMQLQSATEMNRTVLPSS